jgi:hypothetical protein
MATCDSNKSIVSFPASIKSGVSVTQATYDSIEEPLTVEFKWGTRATPPKFITGNIGVIDEVGGGGLSISTVHFHNKIYNLYSVGVYAPSHNSWLLSNKPANRRADLILIFNNPNPLLKAAYDYVFMVIPIIETGSEGDAPSYLTGLIPSAVMPTQGYSLSSCMPGISSQFAYYATCLTSSSGGSSNIIKNAKNAIVFVSLEGIKVYNSLVSSIKSAQGSGEAFPSVSSAPINEDIHIINFQIQAGSILSETDITRYVLTTRVLLDNERTKGMDWVKGARDIRVDSQASYKCVEFDPDKHIDTNGNILIDSSGQILDEVLRERNVVIKAMNTLSDDKSRGNVWLVPYFIGGILGLLFLFSVGMVASKTFFAPTLNVVPAVGTPATAASTSVMQFLSVHYVTIIVGVLSIILGGFLGALIALNGAITSRAAEEGKIKEAAIKALTS